MYPYRGDESYANAVMFDGGEWVLNSRMDQEKGFSVTFEEVTAESDSILFSAYDVDRAKLVFDESGATLDWLEDQGCVFDNPEDHINTGYSMLPIYHVLEGGPAGRDRPLQRHGCCGRGR